MKNGVVRTMSFIQIAIFTKDERDVAFFIVKKTKELRLIARILSNLFLPFLGGTLVSAEVSN